MDPFQIPIKKNILTKSLRTFYYNTLADELPLFNYFNPKLSDYLLIRSKVIDWIFQICLSRGADPQTFYLSTQFLDRYYFSKTTKPLQNTMTLQQITSLCIVLAFNSNEVEIISQKSLKEHFFPNLTMKEYNECTLHVLRTLKFRLNLPTIWDYNQKIIYLLSKADPIRFNPEGVIFQIYNDLNQKLLRLSLHLDVLRNVLKDSLCNIVVHYLTVYLLISYGILNQEDLMLIECKIFMRIIKDNEEFMKLKDIADVVYIKLVQRMKEDSSFLEML